MPKDNSKKRKQPTTLDERLKANQTSIYHTAASIYELDPSNPVKTVNANKKRKNNNLNKKPHTPVATAAWEDDDDLDQAPVKNEMYSDNDMVSINHDIYTLKDEDNIKEEEHISKNDQKKKSQKNRDINLRDNNRLKKLRKEFGENTIKESDLTQRLRQHYETAMPTPDWAKLDTAEDSKIHHSSDNGEEEIKKLELHPSMNISDETVKIDPTTSVESFETIVYEEGDDYDSFTQNERDRASATENLKNVFSTNQRLKNMTHGRGTGTLTTQSLRPGKLFLDRLIDVNASLPPKAVATSVRFHPNNELVMVAAKDTTLRLFQIDAINNPCVQSLAFKDMQVDCADFANNYTEIIACSQRRKYLGVFNLETGQVVRIPEIKGRSEAGWSCFKVSHNGKFLAFLGDNTAIVIVSALTKQFICEIRGRARIQDFAWSVDDSQIIGVGLDGFIYGFDLGSRQQLFFFQDYGAVHSTVVATSTDGKYLATGNNSGTVNIYDTDFSQLIKSQNTTHSSVLSDPFASYYAGYNSYEDNKMSFSSRKDHLAEITNLVTKIDVCTFSPSNEMLVIASRAKKDQLRVIHLPTFKVFENWPTQSTPFSYVQDVAFSHDNSKMAISNDKGKVLLYKLEHYIPNCNKA